MEIRIVRIDGNVKVYVKENDKWVTIDRYYRIEGNYDIRMTAK